MQEANVRDHEKLMLLIRLLTPPPASFHAAVWYAMPQNATPRQLFPFFHSFLALEEPHDGLQEIGISDIGASPSLSRAHEE